MQGRVLHARPLSFATRGFGSHSLRFRFSIGG